MTSFFKALVMQSIFEPAEAARVVLSVDMDMREIWQALALVSVVNAMILSVMMMLFPQLAALPLVGVVEPVILAISMFAVFSGTSIVFFFAGRTLQGIAAFRDILLLFTWLQCLRAVMMTAALVIAMISPFLCSALMFLASLYGFWILLNFLNVAEGFNSLGKSLAVLGLSFIGTMVAFSVLLTSIGVTN